MNKRKKVAWGKHRKKAKKLEDKKRAAKTAPTAGRGAAAAATA